MSFGKRLGLFFTLIVVVPTTALLGILIYVSKDSREGQADAAIASGLTTAIAENSDRTRLGRERAEKLVENPAFASAIRSGKRPDMRAAMKTALAAGDLAVRVLDAEGRVLVRAGSRDAVAFGQVQIADPAAEGKSVVVSVTDASMLAREMYRLTERDLVIFHDGHPVAGTVSPPGGPPAINQTVELEVKGEQLRERAAQLDPQGTDLLVMYGPRLEGGLAAFDGPTPFLLITFLLLVMTFAWGVARELAKLHAQVARQAVTDPLTGLWNRRKLDDMLQYEITRALRFDHSVSLMVLDIDGFKRVNDEHGHQAGDKVLKDVSQLILGFTRAIDEGGRFGGDELALLLPQTGPVGARILAERLCKLVRTRELDEDGLPITISVGVASLPECAADAQSLMAAADGALYEAKRSGRDQVRIARQVEPYRANPSPGRRPGLREKRFHIGRDRRGSGE